MLAATNQLTQRAIERLQETAAQGREKWLYLALAAAIDRDRARDRVRGADRAPDPPARPGDPPDGHAPTSRTRSRSTARRTCAISASASNGCARGCHELEEQQNRFLRHVSHELKTPLTAVREGAELLRDSVGGELSPEQREIVRIVRENTLSLQKLIEDLLTYHQTRAMEPQTLGPVALADVVRRVRARAQARRARAA